MSISILSFLQLVEIQTKVASVIPFILGTVYSLYRFNKFYIRNFFLMFVSLLFFDMTVTAINNYYDYRTAQKTQGYNYESHNVIVRDEIGEKTVIMIIIALLTIAVIAGIMLFLTTNYIVLIMGFISFLAGILYSFGPIPLSRMPLGELFSGFFMGFIIVFLSTYIHVNDQEIVRLVFEKSYLGIKINIIEVSYLILISIPTMIGIANIMLANNICDIEDDIENSRFTLPVYIGKEKSLKLFTVLYYIIYFDIILMVIFNLLPVISLLTILTIIPVYRNINRFYCSQTKKDTFILSVKNFVLVNSVYILTIVVAIIFN